jgi:hypothetical protein
METILIEKEYPHGPFGAKGIGELQWMEPHRQLPPPYSMPPRGAFDQRDSYHPSA